MVTGSVNALVSVAQIPVLNGWGYTNWVYKDNKVILYTLTLEEN